MEVKEGQTKLFPGTLINLYTSSSLQQREAIFHSISNMSAGVGINYSWRESTGGSGRVSGGREAVIA